MSDQLKIQDHQKVAIIGVGYVGASIAYALMIKDLAKEIVLIDKNKDKASGEVLDIHHGTPFMGSTLIYSGDYADCAHSNLIIITAGRNRKQGESRLDLINDNTQIIKEVYQGIRPHINTAVLLVVTNPVDIMTYKLTQWTGLKGRVFGSGCILDTSRFIRSISEYSEMTTENIQGLIVGEHGEGQIPIWSRLTISGLPMETYCQNLGLPWGKVQKEILARKIKSMGARIIASKGQTHYGIASCVCELSQAVLNNQPSIACVSSVLEGEYGINNLALSVPSLIGANGVQKRFEEKWEAEELDQLQAVAAKLKRIL